MSKYTKTASGSLASSESPNASRCSWKKVQRLVAPRKVPRNSVISSLGDEFSRLFFVLLMFFWLGRELYILCVMVFGPFLFLVFFWLVGWLEEGQSWIF